MLELCFQVYSSQMPNICCVPCCGSIESDPKRTLFSTPKDAVTREKWEKHIPRTGHLKPSHRVCDLHFEECDVVKGDSHLINGEKVFVPLRWKLKKDALPRIFPSELRKINDFP